TTTTGAGAITFNDNVSGGANNLNINAAGAVTQPNSTKSITGNQLVLQGAGPFTLANAGNHFAFLAANTTGAINYRDAGALTIDKVALATGVVSGNSAVTIQTGGLLTVGTAGNNETINAGTQTATLTAAGVSITSGAGINAATVDINSSAGVTEGSGSGI